MSGKRIPYGYQLKDGIIEADEETGQMVQEIFETYSRGIPVARLKDYIQGLELSRTKISDILCDTRYLGDENIPQMIDAALFETVQQRRKERLKEIGKEQSYLYHKGTFMLGDKMKCGECGSNWTIVNKKDTIFKYIFWERLDSLPIPECCFHFVWCQIA